MNSATGTAVHNTPESRRSDRIRRSKCQIETASRFRSAKKSTDRLEEPHNSAFLQECSRLMVPGASGVLFIMLNSRGTAMDLDAEALKAKLAALKTEHRDLDEVIALLGTRAPGRPTQAAAAKKAKAAAQGPDHQTRERVVARHHRLRGKITRSCTRRRPRIVAGAACATLCRSYNHGSRGMLAK